MTRTPAEFPGGPERVSQGGLGEKPGSRPAPPPGWLGPASMQKLPGRPHSTPPDLEQGETLLRSEIRGFRRLQSYELLTVGANWYLADAPSGQVLGKWFWEGVLSTLKHPHLVPKARDHRLPAGEDQEQRGYPSLELACHQELYSAIGS